MSFKIRTTTETYVQSTGTEQGINPHDTHCMLISTIFFYHDATAVVGQNLLIVEDS